MTDDVDRTQIFRWLYSSITTAHLSPLSVVSYQDQGPVHDCIVFLTDVFAKDRDRLSSTPVLTTKLAHPTNIISRYFKMKIQTSSGDPRCLEVRNSSLLNGARTHQAGF